MESTLSDLFFSAFWKEAIVESKGQDRYGGLRSKADGYSTEMWLPTGVGPTAHHTESI